MNKKYLDEIKKLKKKHLNKLDKLTSDKDYQIGKLSERLRSELAKKEYKRSPLAAIDRNIKKMRKKEISRSKHIERLINKRKLDMKVMKHKNRADSLIQKKYIDAMRAQQKQDELMWREMYYRNFGRPLSGKDLIHSRIY